MPRTSHRQRLSAWAHAIGGTTLASRLRPGRLSVLTYHRVAAIGPAFDTFRPTVSASPEQFEAHLSYLQSAMTPVSLDQVARAVLEDAPLPPRPVLVTFDDGYRDNVTEAWPRLRARGIPAVVFLATGHVGRAEPFYWDLVAYLLHHTRRTEAELPGLGRCTLHDDAARVSAARALTARCKWLPEVARRDVLAATAHALGVDVPAGAFAGLYMTWDDVRAAADEGLAFGAHTRTHVILPVTGDARARAELTSSRAAIEHALRAPPVAFAYPNGSADDRCEALVREAGFALAFSGRSGPMSLGACRRRPYSIARIGVYARDTVPVLAARLAGADHLFGSDDVSVPPGLRITSS